LRTNESRRKGGEGKSSWNKSLGRGEKETGADNRMQKVTEEIRERIREKKGTNFQYRFVSVTLRWERGVGGGGLGGGVILGRERRERSLF